MSKRKLPAWMLENKLNESSSPNKVAKNNEENINRLNLNDKKPTTCAVADNNNTITVQPPRILTPNEINTIAKELESNDNSGRVLNELPANTEPLTAIIIPQIRTTTPTATTSTNNLRADDETSTRIGDETVQNSNNEIKIIKNEPTDEENTNIASTTNANTLIDVKPNVVNIKTEPTVIKNEAIVQPYSVLRNSCSFGIKCYRRNAEHRVEYAHPGDSDYRRPVLPPAAPGMPACPWGASCYRRNPQHFQQLSHPPFNVYDPNTVGQVASTINIPTTHPPQPGVHQLPITRTRNPNRIITTRVADNDWSDNDDDEEEEDPFANDDSCDEYTPGLDLDDCSDDDDDDDIDNEDIVNTQDLEDDEVD